jgi:hypothetical protein
LVIVGLHCEDGEFAVPPPTAPPAGPAGAATPQHRNAMT